LNTNSNTKNINNENLNSYYYKIINELDHNNISQFIKREKSYLKEFRYINENFKELEHKILQKNI
jgi:cell fate regulator YaaT (PSP1 superfamily)